MNCLSNIEPNCTRFPITLVAIALATALSLSGCGSTGGGGFSKGIGGGSASGTSSGTGTSATNGTPNTTGSSGGSGTSSTATGSGSSASGTSSPTGAPVVTQKEAAESSWDQIVGGAGQVVMQGGETTSAVGSALAKMTPGSSSPAGNFLSAIVTGTGGAVYGIGSGLTTGLEGIGTNQDPVDSLSSALGQGIAQPGRNVTDLGSVISSLSSRPFLVGTNLSPTTSALGSSVSSTGSNLSALQFDSGVMLTSGTVQQVATAVTPLLNPAVIGVIELGSSLGSQLGVGAPLDNLVTQVGGAVAGAGLSVASASSSPVIQGVGTTVAATGVTVAALGGVVHDGQSSNATPGATSVNVVTGLLQAGSASTPGLPASSSLASALSTAGTALAPTLASVGSVPSIGASSSTPSLSGGAGVLPGLAVEASTVVNSTVTAIAVPIAPIASLPSPSSSTLVIPQGTGLTPLTAIVTGLAETLKPATVQISSTTLPRFPH